ncbi:MAG TPA: DUF952 domain-containing protein [Caulobacteraceae bacterium]|nr:DUF952 domain-containing protein [Caulobacteraceae bacterium]
MAKVFKILAGAAWDEARRAGRFAGAAIDLKDGYIHLSTAAQAPETARLHFAGQAGLVLLKLDAERLGEALQWEPSRGGDLFPHLYGVLDVAQVEAVTPIPLGADGTPLLGDLEG